MALDWPNLIAGGVIGAGSTFGVGLVANSTSDQLKFWKAKRNNCIAITSPRAGELLHDARQMSPGLCYRVTGTLGFLPKDHQIWLVIEELSGKQIWPQGFSAVTYKSDSGAWEGFIYPKNYGSGGHIIVAAVVAPSDTQAVFDYYQRHGAQTGWAPLPGIPAECTNQSFVQALVP